jgi:hypothetical protein
MNKHYQVVKIVQSPFFTADMHEFKLLEDGKKAIMTSYQTRQFDMGPFGLTNSMGWIVDSVFYEIEVETGRPLFQWRALDHISPWESYVGPMSTLTSGDGLTAETPWDFFHLNSVDKNSDGDYLISARHTCSIYKISGKDGSIMWSVNGERSDYELDGFTFSHQHDARWLSDNETHTVFSMFDNSGLTGNITYPESRGMIIGLDHQEGIAHLLEALPAPQNPGVSSWSQGNYQILPNGGRFANFGDHPFFAEYNDEGKPISWYKLAYWGSGVNMYRAQKFEWVGEPLTYPTLWTYSATGHQETRQQNDRSLGGMAFHVSWNGATEVRLWRFYVSSNIEGPWASIATIEKKGFETSFHVPEGAWKYAFAEALDFRGKALRRSQIVETTIPPSSLSADHCDNMACTTVRDEDKNTVDPASLKNLFAIQSEWRDSKQKPKDQAVLSKRSPEGDVDAGANPNTNPNANSNTDPNTDPNAGSNVDTKESSKDDQKSNIFNYAGESDVQTTGSADSRKTTNAQWLIRMIPSKKVVDALITSKWDELPRQMDATQTSCSEVHACREQADATKLSDVLSNSMPGGHRKSTLVVLIALVVLTWGCKRRSFRVTSTRYREKGGILSTA